MYQMYLYTGVLSHIDEGASVRSQISCTVIPEVSRTLTTISTSTQTECDGMNLSNMAAKEALFVFSSATFLHCVAIKCD